MDINEINEIDDACCENCYFAQETGIDGLIDCTLDNRSKDYDMSCKDYRDKLPFSKVMIVRMRK